MSNRAAGSRTTTRNDDVPLARGPDPRHPRTQPGRTPQADSALPTAITSEHATRVPPGGQAPLTSGPTKIAAASTQPDAALPAVTSLVVSEISGSRALCTGRVRLMPTVFDGRDHAHQRERRVSEHDAGDHGGRHGLRDVPQQQRPRRPHPPEPRRDGGRQQRGGHDLHHRDHAGAADAVDGVRPDHQRDPGRPLVDVEEQVRRQGAPQPAVGPATAQCLAPSAHASSRKQHAPARLFRASGICPGWAGRVSGPRAPALVARDVAWKRSPWYLARTRYLPRGSGRVAPNVATPRPSDRRDDRPSLAEPRRRPCRSPRRPHAAR